MYLCSKFYTKGMVYSSVKAKAVTSGQEVDNNWENNNALSCVRLNFLSERDFPVFYTRCRTDITYLIFGVFKRCRCKIMCQHMGKIIQNLSPSLSWPSPRMNGLTTKEIRTIEYVTHSPKTCPKLLEHSLFEIKANKVVTNQ